MLVVMQNHATREDIDRVVKTIEEMGYEARPMLRDALIESA